MLPRRLRVLLLTLAAAAALLYLSMRSPQTNGEQSPKCSSPRLISHRGFDQDELKAPSAESVSALLYSGVTSFDVDLFWLSSSTAARPLFVGHPPSVRALWNLTAELPETPLEQVRASKHGKMLFSLEELLSVLRGRRKAAQQTTLELKYTDRPEWPNMLARMYADFAKSGIAEQLGVVVEGRTGAATHRAAQLAAGTRVHLFGLYRDLGAERDGAGLPHANARALAADSSLYDGWSASIKLLHDDLIAAAETHRKPLSVWVADSEVDLLHAWKLKVESVITNRPSWASQLMARWHRQCAEMQQYVYEA